VIQEMKDFQSQVRSAIHDVSQPTVPMATVLMHSAAENSLANALVQNHATTETNG